MYKNFQQNINMVGVYDGNKASVDLNYDINGNSKHYHIQLNNKDISEILGTQPVAKSLEQRLIDDFKMTTSSFKKNKSKKHIKRKKSKTHKKFKK